MEVLMPTYPEKTYDVTNCGEAYGASWLGIITRKSLELQKEEIVLRTSNCCATSVQKRPYAQLNLVEHRSICFGMCNAINSDLAPIDEDGNGGIIPGCGCDSVYVQEIVRELNLRKEGRGKVAQMRQQKYMLEKITQLSIKVPMMLKALGVEYPPSDATLRRLFSEPPDMRPLPEVIALEPLPDFGTNQYDITNCAQSCLCTSRLLELEPDEAQITTRQSLTGSVMTAKVPYANIDSVDAKNVCCCCSILTAGELTKPPGKEMDEAINPGCGCNGMLVEQIRSDLQARVEVRGNLGQIRQLEKMMSKFHDISAELPLILDKIGADTSYPPRQETMTSLYGSAAPDLSASVAPHATPSAQFETREFNVRNETSNCLDFVCTCSTAGCSTHTLTLEPEQAVSRRSNRCYASVDRKPYGQLGSVDEAICCCVHNVNGVAPGWCGDPAMVKEIAAELQARKVGRGNIAQLRNQENTMLKALEADVRTDVLLQKRGIEYPPPQQVLQAVYGSAVPQLPPPEPVHMSASEQLDTRSYPITSCCDQYCCCATHTMELNDEEAIFRFNNCCCQRTVREPYAQLGSVEPVVGCMGLVSSVHTDQNHICPGCGCDHPLVNEIGSELQNRKVKRGNIAQIRMQENLIIEVIKLGIKYDLILHKEGIQYPPSQSKMREYFGEGAALPDLEAPSAPRRSSRSFMQVIVPAGLRAGDAFQVTSPLGGQFEVTVPQGVAEGQAIQVEIPTTATGRETELAPLAYNAS